MKLSSRVAKRLNIFFLSFSILLILFLVLLIGYEKIYSAVISADSLLLVMSLPFIGMAFLVRILKTWLFFRRFDIYTSVKKAGAFVFAVNMLGSVSPFRSGEITASLSVSKPKRKKTLSVIIIDRFLEMMASLALILISSLFVQQSLVSNYRVFILIGILAAIFIAILIFGERFWEFRRHLKSLTPGFLSLAFTLAVIATLFESAYLLFIFRAFSIEVTFIFAVFLQQTANAIAVLASLPGGLGSREAYLMTVLSGMGFLPSAAISSEFIYKAISWIIFLPLGAHSLFYLEKEKIKQARNRSSHQEHVPCF